MAKERRTHVRHIIDTRQRGRVLKHVADELGLVSFGAVDHHSDEHDVIRGLTVSTTHKDRHYIVGNHQGYDIALVDRSDRFKRPRGGSERHNWVILQVALPNVTEMPRLFLMPSTKDDRFLHLFAGERHLSPLDSYVLTDFKEEFTRRYTPYVTPRSSHSVQDILDTHFTGGLAAHFWPHAVEWHRQHVYVYITEHRLDEAVVLGALSSALWLADALDQRYA